jgi:hypothetical protein
MAITRTPIIDDDGTGTTGTVIDNAWKTELYNQIDGVVGGAGWANVTFNVANFWTGVTAGMLAANRFTVINKTLFWQVQIVGAPAPAPGTASLLLVTPVSPVFGVVMPVAYAVDAGGAITGAVFLDAAGSTKISVYKTSGNWSGTVYCYFTAIIPLT